MKNIIEIQSKLTKLRDRNVIHQLMNTVPEAMALKIETKEALINAATIFVNKLIKHLDSKKPSKSSITNLVYRSFNKLQYAGFENDGLNCFLAIVTVIINNNFEDAFSDRVNVKSKEFLDLEDSEPF